MSRKALNGCQSRYDNENSRKELQAMNDELGKDFSDLWACLSSDINLASQLLITEDTQYNRRCLLRSVMSAFEAIAYYLKRACLVVAVPTCEKQSSTFSLAEQAMLNEEVYTINSKGQAISSARFIPVSANIRFSIDMYYKAFGLTSKIDIGVSEWQSLIAMIEIRNRTTHPKSVDGLLITDEELQVIHLATNWFMITLLEVLMDVNHSLKTR